MVSVSPKVRLKEENRPYTTKYQIFCFSEDDRGFLPVAKNKTVTTTGADEKEKDWREIPADRAGNAKTAAERRKIGALDF